MKPSHLNWRDGFLPEIEHRRLVACLQEHHGSLEQGSSWFASHGLHSSLLPLDRLDPLLRLLNQVLSLFLEETRCTLGAAGLEWWINRNSKHDWHLDKDEALFKQSGKLRLASWSYLYYVEKPISGGELELMANPLMRPYSNSAKTKCVEPEIARMVSFDSKYYHRVRPYQGSRLSIAMNAWSEPPSEFTCRQKILF